MFQYTTNELDVFVRQTGFLKNSLEKILRVIDILSSLKSNSVTKDAFALKGGTALNLFVLNFPRLSVDMDLDYIRFVSKSDMLRDREEIIAEIQKIFLPEYRIQITKEVHALTQFSFRYRTMSGSSDMLKVEINFMRRVPLLTPRIRSFKRLDQHLDFLCLDDHELLAGKIIALLSRYTPRDIYDIYQMSSSFSQIDGKLLRSLLLFYGITARASIFELFKLKFELINQRDIRNILRPLLRSREYPSRDEMVSRVEKFLSPYLSFTTTEIDLIRNFYKTGELNINILFPQKEVQKRIRISPSLKWKIQNIK